MRPIVVLLAAASLSACGLDTASSAATAAALKKQERLEQAKKTMDQSQQKIGQSMDQLQQSQQSREDAAK